MFVTIDRLEGENAVIELETTDMVCVPLAPVSYTHLFRTLWISEFDTFSLST